MTDLLLNFFSLEVGTLVELPFDPQTATVALETPWQTVLPGMNIYTHTDSLEYARQVTGLTSSV
jgi:hypothetical protein